MCVYGHPPITGPDVFFFFLPGSQTTIWLGSAQALNPTPTPALLGGLPAVPCSDPRPGAPVLWEPEPGPVLIGGPFWIVGHIVGLWLQGHVHEWTGISISDWKLNLVKRMWYCKKNKKNNGFVDLFLGAFSFRVKWEVAGSVLEINSNHYTNDRILRSKSNWLILLTVFSLFCLFSW